MIKYTAHFSLTCDSNNETTTILTVSQHNNGQHIETRVIVGKLASTYATVLSKPNLRQRLLAKAFRETGVRQWNERQLA